ncbi:hypothetical protein Patl1_29945 [Pistacia atlantica]|uniref:Uncharacterized protein n=1 Tax=Pistacia atlantica TaxID=434234 RepID=A0ACC1AC39_9ROSI|nr:hypothetical protein Patl1_29945 [Pistacia atlantica]
MTKTVKFNHETQILKLATLSRLLLLTLTILWRALLSPYDTSASLNPDCLADPGAPQHSRNNPISSAIENGVVWDSVFFVRIAQCGYEYEQSFAFLPLLPLCIRLLSHTGKRMPSLSFRLKMGTSPLTLLGILAPLVSVFGYRAVLALSGYVVSNVAFLLAAVYFYRLSVMILKDPEAALRASILFCFNPASIFYSSIYSESLYALFSVGGLYYLMSGANNIAVICLAVSSCARSNGVLAMQILICGALRCICIFIPFIAFQVYGYHNLCLGHSPQAMRPWCRARIPLLYNFIQSHYWGVGFLKYFQLKQLPNFLLASPILSLALCSIIYYVTAQPKLVYLLGFQAFKEGKDFAPVPFPLETVPQSNSASATIPEKPSSKTGNQNFRQRKQIHREGNPAVLPLEYGSSVNSGYLSVYVLPFILHLSFMVATAFFVMHVQVATRFLSASPSLYWFASYLMASPGTGKTWGYLIWAYCTAYILLGSLLFSNFYPFT